MGIATKTQKRYALLLAARDSEYVKKVYCGYFNVFVSAFGEKGERWDLFRVVEGEFPEMDEIHKYDGFVVSGSPFDAYSHESWILNLCVLLQSLHAMKKRVLGICFGHQILCRALGGKVKKASSGWDIGIRKVRINFKDFPPSFSFIKDSVILMDEVEEIPPSLSIIECHQDEVWEVPAGAQAIAFSDKTHVEMFTFESHILGIQGHPEYTKDILNNIIDRLLMNSSIEKDIAENARSELKINEPDRKCWEHICKTFLKGEKDLFMR